LVPEEVRALFAAHATALAPGHQAWRAGIAAWRAREPERAPLWDAHVERRVPADLFARLIAHAPAGPGATRAHGGALLQEAAALIPALAGGSADLEPSTRTAIRGAASIA